MAPLFITPSLVSLAPTSLRAGEARRKDVLRVDI
jgi:hypothetical protein